MKNSYKVEVNGQKLNISDVEFLFSYENENQEKLIVFEYEGETYHSKVKDE
jgi:hypothetical protein